MLDSSPTGSESTLSERQVESDIRDRLVVAVWAVLIGVFTAAIWSRRWVSDDGFINLRIVENILSGHGPVFNIGERVEAGTSQIWLAVVGLADVFAGHWLSIEWVAVVVGIACSVATLVVAVVTQRRVWAAPVVPVGLLGWVPLSAVWDFSTSGLETPLLWLWLASCFGVLATRASWLGTVAGSDNETRTERWDPPRRWVPVLIGLGPLIRPDAAIYTLAFIVALVLMTDRSRAVVLRSILWALVIPGVYTVFRAGYFGVLVPNTAIVKEAGSARWGSGLAYLTDFVVSGGLFIAAVMIGLIARRVLHEHLGAHPLRVLWNLSWIAALVHAVWVIRVGGDFMQSRMLLADWLLFILPVAALPLKVFDARIAKALLAILGLWCLISAAAIRPSFESAIARRVVDERSFYVAFSHNSNPVTLKDHADNEWMVSGREARRRASRGESVIVYRSLEQKVTRFPSRSGTYLATPNIGMMAVAAGPDVHVVDTLGLADPIASRLEPHANRRIGHAKELTPAWIVARFGIPNGDMTSEAAIASEVLACPPVVELLDSVTAQLTPGRFVENLMGAPRRTFMRIPNDPAEARKKLC